MYCLPLCFWCALRLILYLMWASAILTLLVGHREARDAAAVSAVESTCLYPLQTIPPKSVENSHGLIKYTIVQFLRESDMPLAAATRRVSSPTPGVALRRVSGV